MGSVEFCLLSRDGVLLPASPNGIFHAPHSEIRIRNSTFRIPNSAFAMVALVQRVSEASVDIDGETVGSIQHGLLILLGVHEDDTETESEWCASKCAHLRVFPDDDGRMDESLLDTEGEALVVPQFTLYGDTSKGNRPSFTEAAPPDQAEELYEHFVEELEHHLNQKVPTGEFGALMDVHLTNDGPVTLWVERRADD